MNVKKDILQSSEEYNAETRYYEEAATCPQCGNKARYPTETFNNFFTTWLFYKCDCGCIWKVKGYKQKRASKRRK